MELQTLKRQFIIIIGLLLLISGVATFTSFSGIREQTKVGIPEDADPARVKACNDFMTVATFPDEGAADAFFQKCITGEESLPGDEVFPMNDNNFLEIQKQCDEIMMRVRFDSEESRNKFYLDCLNGRN